MILKFYIFLILLILFSCHVFRKTIEFRKYKQLLKDEHNSEYLESRSFKIIDKYEKSNLKRFSPPSYIIKLQSVERKESYEEELVVSLGTYLKTKIGEIKSYDVYTVFGSNEVLLVDKKEKKHFFFDEIKVLLFSEYVLIAILACLIIIFLLIELFL